MTSLTLSANVNNTIPNVSFNDLYLNNEGDIETSTDLQSVLEQCSQVARTLLGECIFDTTVGIPYEQVVWVGVPNLAQFSAALRVAFLGVPGVTQVINIDLIQLQVNASSGIPVSQSADMLSFRATIQTIYGLGVIQ